MSSTLAAAQLMLASGQFYSASLLAREMGISAIDASGKLANIRHSKKYQCEVTPLPGRTVRVIAIAGRATPPQALWQLVLFQRPLPAQGVNA